MGEVDLVLHVRPCEGLVRQLDGTVEKRFAKKELLVPLQVEAFSRRGFSENQAQMRLQRHCSARKHAAGMLCSRQLAVEFGPIRTPHRASTQWR